MLASGSAAVGQVTAWLSQPGHLHQGRLAQGTASTGREHSGSQAGSEAPTCRMNGNMTGVATGQGM